MNADQLRERQAPLKERYRADPTAGLKTLHANATLGDGITCNVETWNDTITPAGLHPATGGDGSEACAGDMLLQALVACAGVTLKAVATAIGVELRHARISAEGDLDFRGTLGVAKDAQVGFKQIRLKFFLDTDAEAEKIASLLKLTERYCVIYQTLAQPPAISVSHSSVRG